jgi:hypothetical protein
MHDYFFANPDVDKFVIAKLTRAQAPASSSIVGKTDSPGATSNDG